VAATAKQVERYTYSRSFGTKRGSGNKNTPDAKSAVQSASGSDGEPYDGRLSRTVRWAGIRLTQLTGFVLFILLPYIEDLEGKLCLLIILGFASLDFYGNEKNTEEGLSHVKSSLKGQVNSVLFSDKSKGIRYYSTINNPSLQQSEFLE